MDTWQGNNFDPVTLHKYLYANIDPVHFVDPTGHFGMAELSVTINIVSTLTSLQIDNAFNVFDQMGVSDPAIDNARLVNRVWGILSMGTAGTQLIKLLSKKGKAFFKKAGTSNVSSLKGTQFEDYLVEVMGSSGPFKKGGREFDGAWGKVWFEAKSGNYFTMIMKNPKELAKFKSQMGKGNAIASQNGASYALVSNTPIPAEIKDWLTSKSLRYVEVLD